MNAKKYQKEGQKQTLPVRETGKRFNAFSGVDMTLGTTQLRPVDSRPISGLPDGVLEFVDSAISIIRKADVSILDGETWHWSEWEGVGMVYADALAWYWDLIMHSSDALVAYDFEAYEFYEEWRKAIKGGMLNA